MGTSLAPIGRDFRISAVAGATSIAPLIPRGPVIIESPHHSLFFPEDAVNYNNETPAASGMVDRYVGDLVLPLKELAPVLLNNMSRLYIDANRARDCINVKRVQPPLRELNVDGDNQYSRADIWLIPTLGLEQKRPKVAKPDEATIQERLKIWELYHQQVHDLIESRHQQAGEILHLSMHSFPGSLMRESEVLKDYDVILGTLDDTTADPAITGYIKECFEQQGYRVLVNQILRGGELVRQHGDPENGRHSVQIEMERDLFMNPFNLELKPAGFQKLQQDLQVITASICDFMHDRAVTRKLEQTAVAAPDPLQMAAQ